MDEQLLNTRKFLIQADHLAKGYDGLDPDLSKESGGFDWWRPTRVLCRDALAEPYSWGTSLADRIAEEMVPRMANADLCFAANLRAVKNLCRAGEWLAGQNIRLLTGKMDPTVIAGRMKGNGPLTKYYVGLVLEKGQSKFLTIISTGRRVDIDPDRTKIETKYPTPVFEALLLDANSLMRRANLRPFYNPCVIDSFSGNVFLYSDNNRTEEAISLLERTRFVFCSVSGFARPEPDLFDHGNPLEQQLIDLGI